MNEFADPEETLDFAVSVPPERVEREQKAALRKLKKLRSAEGVAESLEGLRRDLSAGANLLPPIIAAVKARATLGEITAVLKEAFGEYREKISV